MTKKSSGFEGLPMEKAEALERIGGDEAFLQELLVMYDEEYVNKKNVFEKAIRHKDFSSIYELGHSLKGSSANLSLPRLRDAAFALEMAGKEKNIKNAETAFDELKREYLRLKKYLKNE